MDLKDTKHKINTIYFSLFALSGLVVIGVIGYMELEHYTLLEAFYMTIITMSTVGYEEVHAMGNAGMLFTTFLIILSFGIFAYALSTATRFLVDGDFRRYYKFYQVEKKLKNIDKHVIVCGYGRNGRQATLDLLSHNETVVVIESDELVAEQEQNPAIIFVTGDAIEEETLERAQLHTAKALITTLPSDANNLFVVLTAREMNEKLTIISRASNDHSDSKLKRAGANNVIMPDRVGGQRMAKLVSEPDIVEFLDYILLKTGDEVKLEEISCNQMATELVNKTIAELDIRNISGANLIGLKTEDGAYIFNPDPSIRLMPEDKLFAIGRPTQIARLRSVLLGRK